MLKAFLNRVVPSRFRPFTYLMDLTVSRCNQQVRQGPFQGMRYVRDSQGSCLIPKLLGIYERELYHVIEQICRMDADLLIDVGAAEGYYAVGIAIRRASLKVVAFEMAEHGRALLAEMCGLNSIGNRVEIRGKCEPADLQAELSRAKSAVLIVDCEGYEQVLLDPLAVPELLRTSILVEIHEIPAPGVTELLRTRFAKTHTIETIQQQDRSVAEYPFSTPYTAVIPMKYKQMAVSEARWDRQPWLWMRPKTNG